MIKLNQSSILTDLINLFTYKPIKIEKIANVPNTELGAREYLRLIAGVILANWDNIELYEFAKRNDINYLNHWLEQVFVYKKNPDIGELLLKPQTIIEMYNQTGKITGDCKVATIITGSILMNYHKLALIDDVYVYQVINPNHTEKHIVAGYRTGTILKIIDPTTEANIDPERLGLYVKLT